MTIYRALTAIVCALLLQACGTVGGSRTDSATGASATAIGTALSTQEVPAVSPTPASVETSSTVVQVTDEPAPTIESALTPVASLVATSTSDLHPRERWLHGVPCALPCFENVTLGQTTVDEAINIWQGSGLFTRLEKRPSQGNRLLLEWRSDIAEFDGSAYYDDDNKIEWVIPRFTGSYKLVEIIEKFGEPNYVIAYPMGSVDGTGVAYILKIIFSDQGFYLETSAGSANYDEELITDLRSVVFEKVVFFTPGMKKIEQQLAGDIEAGYLVPWQGLQDFKFYCRDLTKGSMCSGQYWR